MPRPEFVDSGWDQTPSGRLFWFLASHTALDLPADGYVLDPSVDPTQRTTHWARYVHRTGSAITATVLLHEGNPPPGIATSWKVTQWDACAPSSFDPTEPLASDAAPWKDAAGKELPRDVISSNAGPGHCGWESTTWLGLGQHAYIRDPLHVLADYTATSYLPDTTLPAGSTDTGYHTKRFELWRGPSTSSVYVVTAGHVERWPAVNTGCA